MAHPINSYTYSIKRMTAMNASQPSLFIHVPKTASLSTVSCLNTKIDLRIHSVDCNVETYITRNSLENFFKFGFKRNPYKRFASLFQYFRTMDEQHPYYKYNQPIVKAIRNYDSLPEFAKDFCNLRIIKNFHFWPQTDYLLDKHGDLLVDYLGSVETLDHDLPRLWSLLSSDSDKNPPVVERKNSSGAWERLEIDDTVIKTVNNYYSRDITMLGYTML